MPTAEEIRRVQALVNYLTQGEQLSKTKYNIPKEPHKPGKQLKGCVLTDALITTSAL